LFAETARNTTELVNEVLASIKNLEKPEFQKIKKAREELTTKKKDLANIQSLFKSAQRKQQVDPASLTPDEQTLLGDQATILKQAQEFETEEEKQKEAEEPINDVKTDIKQLIDDIRDKFTELHKDIKDNLDKATTNQQLMQNMQHLQDRYRFLESEIRKASYKPSPEIKTTLRQIQRKSKDITAMLSKK
jgi:chromosome segregation ATPase